MKRSRRRRAESFGSGSGGEDEDVGVHARELDRRSMRPKAPAAPVAIRGVSAPGSRGVRTYALVAIVIALAYVATNGFVVLSHLQDSRRSVPVLRGIIRARVKGVDTRLEDVVEELESVKKRLVESTLEHERRLVALEVSSHLLVEQVKVLKSKRTVQAVLIQQLVTRELAKKAKEAKTSKQTSAKIKRAARARTSAAAGAPAAAVVGQSTAAGPAAAAAAAAAAAFAVQPLPAAAGPAAAAFAVQPPPAAAAASQQGAAAATPLAAAFAVPPTALNPGATPAF